MKISLFQPNINYYSMPKSEVNKPHQSSTPPTFTAGTTCAYRDLVRKRLPQIGPDVTSDIECCNILNRIFNYKTYEKKPLFDIEYNRQRYPKIKKNQEGLLLYAGYTDLSGDMNRFLSGREMYTMTKPQACDVVRVFDYSLKKLDEKYGKYSGIVYRQGFFPLGQHQYISTTTDPVIAATLRGGISLNKNLEFSIINTKSGHKIKDFQRKMGSDYAEEEEEILLSRKAKFKEITEPQGYYLTLRNKFHKILQTYAHCEIDPKRIRIFEELSK